MSKGTSQNRPRGPDGVSRRSFFASMGAIAGGVAGSALASGDAHAQSRTPANEPSGTGYRETEHVKTYYDLARF